MLARQSEQKTVNEQMLRILLSAPLVQNRLLAVRFSSTVKNNRYADKLQRISSKVETD
jgi:hypothetical protein